MRQAMSVRPNRAKTRCGVVQGSDRGGVGGKGLEISFARPLRGSVWVGDVKETVSGARRSMGPTLPSGLCRLASGNGRRWRAGLGSPSPNHQR